MMRTAMKRSSVLKAVVAGIQRAYLSLAVGSDIVSAAPNVSLQKARSWDEGVSSKFATTPLHDIFKGKKVVIFGLPIEFYGDFEGKFHKSLDLTVDLSSALLGTRSTRWSAYVEDCKVKVLNVEKAPSEFKVSGGDHILAQI